MIGKTVSHYRILGKLGGGGMGEVCEGKDTRLDRWVAIKVLQEKLLDSYEAKERFQREAKSASALNHPYICTVYDVGESANRWPMPWRRRTARGYGTWPGLFAIVSAAAGMWIAINPSRWPPMPAGSASSRWPPSAASRASRGALSLHTPPPR